MEIEDVLEWIQLADNDLYSAQILNEGARKVYEIVCYHCAQATEKYLKAYLTCQDIMPEKTHNLLFLNKLCMEKDNEFNNIATLCDFLNRFANDIRYPHKYEVNDNDANFSINAVERIRNIKPIIDLRNKINDESNNQEDDIVK
ncbi:MAG: HEPN domain-containing protein [Spirochaetales bacterium]|jgi:HEPN domain-containing protein|nr:HEPN domain-containing protein [Spirochaetales bacterium]